MFPFNYYGRSKPLSTYKAISATDPSSVIAEQYRKIRTNIDLSNIDTPIKTIAITSSMGAEGKSITAINLATVYAQSENKTLIIDLDLRKPKIHRGFDMVNEFGVADVIAHGYPLEKAIRKINDFLYVLPAGVKLPFPSEFLGSMKFKAFIQEVTKDYDRVIIDTPPVNAVADALIIGKQVDGVLFVIASRSTTVDTAQSVLKNLRDNSINLLGAVLTRVHKKDHRYLNYYSYAYAADSDE